MPSGSNPFIGSSRINIFGSFNKHNPIPNLCLIPNEKFLTNFFSTLFTKFNYIKKHAVFKHTKNIPHIKSDSHLSTIQTLSSQRKKKIKLINFGKRKLTPIPSIYNNINQYNTISMNNIIITSTQKEKKPLMVNNYSEGNINKITRKSLYTFPIINRIIYKKDYTNYVNNLRERSKQRKVITNRKET